MHPEELDIPTSGGSLRALRWGAGSRIVVALHGITSSAMAWAAVAEHLPADWSLVAPDLRGRGRSAGLPGPYGLDRHVADVAVLIKSLADQPPVLAGHSMGAYVALLAFDAHPGMASRLVLVDGGLPLPAPADADVDSVLDSSLGPAIGRLSQTFPTVEAYLKLWQAHPAFIQTWNGHVDAYVRYDLTGDDGSLRSCAAPDAVRADGRDLLLGGGRFGAALERLTDPTVLLTAPIGLLGQPPGIHPPALVQAWRQRVGALRPRLIPGVNHYTMMFTPQSSAVVARSLAGEEHG